MNVNILGSEWTIIERTPHDDDMLVDNDGYCDYSCRRIVINGNMSVEGCDDIPALTKHVLRHELIHAAMYESGLGNNWRKEEFGHDETVVDWIALQFDKLQKIFEQVGCI